MLTREQIEFMRAGFRCFSTDDEQKHRLDALCDLALLGLAQEQNNAAGASAPSRPDRDASQPESAAAPIDRIAELEAKIARMRPSKEAVKWATHMATNMSYSPTGKTRASARELLRIFEEAK